MTAKEIYELIKAKPYKDGEKMIKDYAKQKIEERDEQWKLAFHSIVEQWKLAFHPIVLKEKLPEPKFE